MTDLHFFDNAILIDKEHKNKKLKAYNEDEYKQFIKQKHLVDRKYLERDIEYNFNSQGYRTTEIAELDRDFVLVFGCSHTEGIGNFEEDIWCAQLLDKKGIDFLNLGKAGSGPDIIFYNTIQFLKNNYPRPKAVINQWPQNFRKSFAYKLSKDIILKHHNINTKNEKRDTLWFLKRYCQESGEMSMNNFMHYNTVNQLWKNLNIPVLNWTWKGDFTEEFEDLNIIETKDTGRARDLEHDGADIHKQVSTKLDSLLDIIM